MAPLSSFHLKVAIMTLTWNVSGLDMLRRSGSEYALVDIGQSNLRTPSQISVPNVSDCCKFRADGGAVLKKGILPLPSAAADWHVSTSK